MAFHYVTGVAAAPNEIDNWFAAFEAWITGTVGWIVSSGSGTDNLVIESVGEAGDKTMLFVRVFRVGVTNVVRMEVRDDAVGTHETTLGQGLDSGGVQFNYWMSADLDAIVIVWERGGIYYLRYAGLVMPFSLFPADETYYSVTFYRIGQAGRVLRRYDGLWDQADIAFYANEWISEALVDRDDGSFPIGGMLFGDHADTAGQFKHMSCQIQAAAITVLDTIRTNQADGTTEWLVLRDQATLKFALRTGGIYPTGDVMDQGNFAHVSGVAYTAAQFFDAIVAFMAGRGWTTTDISGASGRPIDWEFNSTGESGTDDIWVRVSFSGGPNEFSLYVADSALGTPGRHETTAAWIAEWWDWIFPTQFYISGDRDCVLMTVNRKGVYIPVYGGLVMPTAPNLSSSFMSSVSIGGLSIAEMNVLLGHDGVWDENILWQRGGDDAYTYDSSPNLYDGNSTILWATNLRETIGGPGELIGQMKYFYAAEGDPLALCDAVRVADQVYRVFYFVSAGYVGWAMRIV